MLSSSYRREFGKDRTNLSTFFQELQNEKRKDNQKVSMKKLIYFEEKRFLFDAVPLSGEFSLHKDRKSKTFSFFIPQNEEEDASYILRFAQSGSSAEQSDIFPSELMVHINQSRFPISHRNLMDSFGKPLII